MQTLNCAISFAKKHHYGQKRKTGEDYFIHCEYVMNLVKNFNLGENYEKVAILHDIIEDSDLEKEDLYIFGKEIAEMVDILTKKNTGEKSITRVEKYIKNMSEYTYNYPEILMIKMCDQLHNLKTLYIMKQSKKEEIISEIKNYYLPFYKKELNKAPLYLKKEMRILILWLDDMVQLWSENV